MGKNHLSVASLRAVCAVLAGMAGTLGMAGCSSTSSKTSTSGGSGGGGGGNYVEQYASGQYSDAYNNAVEATGTQRGPKRDQAALTAGLSAHALNRDSEAIRWLGPLENNSDPGVSGKSSATLGLIAQQRGEHETAIKLLTRASQKLTGDESARAAMYAGDSYRAMGNNAEATRMYKQAESRLATDENLKLMLGDRLQGRAPFAAGKGGQGTGISTGTRDLTVQVGAFKDRATADREAKSLASRGVTARVVPISRDAQQLWAVRVGKFSNRSAAENIRKSVGGKAVITVASGE